MVQDVQLSERSILRLGHHEIGKDEDASSGTKPDESRFPLQVPSGRVERVGSDVTHGHGKEVVGGSSEGAALGSELDRGELGDNGKRDGTDGETVRGVDEHEEGGLNPERGGRFGGRREDTNDHQKRSLETHTVEVKGSSTNVGHTPEGADDSDPLDRSGTETESKRIVGTHSSNGVKVGGLVAELESGPELRSKQDARGQGSDSVDTFETFNVASSLGLLVLDFDGSLHHGNHVVGVSGDTSSFKSSNRSSGLFQSTLPDQPPGGFGRKEEDCDEGKRPSPLDCKGNLEAPLLSARDCTVVLTLVLPFRNPYKIPAVKSCPVHQQDWLYMVKIPRNGRGAISDAYAWARQL